MRRGFDSATWDMVRAVTAAAWDDPRSVAARRVIHAWGHLTDAAVGLPEPFRTGRCTYCSSETRGSHSDQCQYALLVIATDEVLRAQVEMGVTLGGFPEQGGTG